MCSSLLPKWVFGLFSEHFSFTVKLMTQPGLYPEGIQSCSQMAEQRAMGSSRPTLTEVLGDGFPQVTWGRLDVSLYCVGTGRALPGQDRWVSAGADSSGRESLS